MIKVYLRIEDGYETWVILCKASAEGFLRALCILLIQCSPKQLDYGVLVLLFSSGYIAASPDNAGGTRTFSLSGWMLCDITIT